jgi:4-amino-4-deoxy-L-arabinose transferase-like glycosyltransferase
VGPIENGLLNYLNANTRPGTYLLATDRASDAATYILATGRPVLAFGGFLGQYNEVSVDQLAALVKSGHLRFVLSQGLQGHQANRPMGRAELSRGECQKHLLQRRDTQQFPLEQILDLPGHAPAPGPP